MRIFICAAVLAATFLPASAHGVGLGGIKLAFQPEPAPCIARYMLMRNSVPKGSPPEQALAEHIVVVRNLEAKAGKDVAELAKTAQTLARAIHEDVTAGKKTVDDVIFETVLCDKAFDLDPVFETRDPSD